MVSEPFGPKGLVVKGLMFLMVHRQIMLVLVMTAVPQTTLLAHIMLPSVVR